MKMVMVGIFSLLISGQLYANGGAISTGTSNVDEKYLKVFAEEREEAKQSKQTTREKAAESPRNRAFPGSFKKIGESEQKEERQEESKGIKDLEDDPYYKEKK